MSKRVLAIVMAMCLALSCFILPASAASSITISEETFPTSYVQGKTFSVYGNIKSTNKITSVTAGAYNSDSSAAFSYTAKPNATTYNLHNLDSYMTFSKLTKGSYTYKVSATDSAGTTVTLLNKNFTVTSGITISGANYPTSYTKGKTFSVQGSIKSVYNLTSVTAGAYKSDSTAAFSHTAKPNTTSFDVHSMDSYMTFSKLDAGTYTYKITATASNGASETLVSKSFTVTASTTTPTTPQTPTQQSNAKTISISSQTYPSHLVSGSSFSISGNLSSSYSITSVTAGVYDTSGKTVFSQTAKPGSTSYSVKNLDSGMTFSKLAKGTYYYKIMATNSKETNAVVWTNKFTVVDSSTAIVNKLTKKTTKCIDISYWDTINSWSTFVKNFDEVILRIGYRGTATKVIIEDKSFAEFYKQMNSYKIPVGVYFYSAALSVTEAREEAEFVLSTLKKYKCSLSMPVYFDFEADDQWKLPKSLGTAIAREFCDTVAAAGYCPGIYCSKCFAEDVLYPAQLTDITMWIAQYNTACTYKGQYEMWQYSETGVLSGTNDKIDLSHCYYDFPSYIKTGSSGLLSDTSSFSLKQKTGMPKIKVVGNTVLTDALGFTTAEFTSAYVTKTSDVTLSYSSTVDGKVTTGTVLTVKNSSKTLGTYTIAVVGDVDSDNTVSSSDALKVLQYIANEIKFTDIQKSSADVNYDGNVNTLDALELLKKVVG